MNSVAHGALRLARPVITSLLVLNSLYALGIAGLVAFSFSHPEWYAYLGFFGDVPHNGFLIGMRAIMAIGLAGAVLTHVVLARLRAVVDTVRLGDPFTLDNARRLSLIAWCLLAGQGLHLAVVAIADAVSRPTYWLDFGSAFTIAPWLAVLLLFVLARVFAEGARMRADLEGTV